MTTTPYEPKDSRALTALTEIYSDNAEPATAVDIDRGLNSLLARVSSASPRQGRVRWPIAVAALALCALVALQVTSLIRKRVPSPELALLTYRVDGGRVLEGGYLREAGHAGVNVTFNEGSQFRLAPKTRGRIREVVKEGAHVAIEHGTATLNITPGAGRRWLVDVGPFVVTVKGTVFTVSWDPLSEHFGLDLQRGSVLVSGPVSAGEIALRAGQHLSVNLAKAQTVITEDSTEETTSDAVGASVPQQPAKAEPSSSGASLEPTEAALPHAPSAKNGERRWSEELAHGQWDRILDEAKRAGIDTTLAEGSSDDLFAVANAARYRRQPDLARSALLALRRRFPNSPRALDAIYLLARVEESRGSGTAQAIARYDEYLARAPNGPFAGEALGRKMTLTEALEGPARARPVAEDYLRRFPKGSYAGSAHALIRVQSLSP
jgi:ferric-dicitrate binding protein FerR (iron transport regulator)